MIKLNKEISIDIPKLIQSKLVILANSGGGKSYAIRRIAEQAVGQVQVIIIDPEGEFSSLREKYDFILAGKNADVPVEVRSSALLATKLLELNKSAVIDLYELHPSERQRYVKNFCDALVNAPKELYHPVIIILDEAHEYVPEGKPSEATWAVELLASKGRKRGQCLILASQRIAKISKNVTAECNNKLIGRASQDIDMKRAGDELGFSKDKLVELRQLKPGEFFSFGPAISDEVIRLKIGEVQTAHAKVGYKGGFKTPPPSNVIKKVLAELKDLPHEAEKEVKTVKELQARLAEASRELARLGKKEVVDPKVIHEAVKKSGIEWEKIVKEKNLIIDLYRKGISIIEHTMDEIVSSVKKRGITDLPDGWLKGSRQTYDKVYPADLSISPNIVKSEQVDREASTDGQLGKGEIIVLKAIAQHPEGISTEHIAVLTGYKQTSRRVYLQKLAQRGFVQNVNNTFYPTNPGVQALGDDFESLPTGDALREHVLRTLPEGERKILDILIGVYPGGYSVLNIEDLTGYKTTSRRVYVQRLTARKLVETNNGVVFASDKLFD